MVADPHRPRRGLPGLALAVAALLLVALTATHPRASQRSAGVRTASCQGQSTTGPITWAARYEPTRAADGAAGLRILEVGTQASPNRIDAVTGDWEVSWTSPITRATTLPIALAAARVVPATAASLLTPDRDCSLYLSIDPPPGPLVGVVGDSIFAAVATRLAGGASPLAELPDATWEIRTTSGFGWSASAPTWPLETVRGTWAIGQARGIIAQRPSALVVELGADDALRAMFADVTDHPVLAQAVRAAVSDNVKQVLRASSGVPCVVIVTTPEHPTSLFAGGATYAREATQVDQILETDAKEAGPNVRIADWATFSAGHHSGPGDWFLPDNVHPTITGDVALVGLIERSLLSCPAAANL